MLMIFRLLLYEISYTLGSFILEFKKKVLLFTSICLLLYSQAIFFFFLLPFFYNLRLVGSQCCWKRWKKKMPFIVPQFICFVTQCHCISSIWKFNVLLFASSAFGFIIIQSMKSILCCTFVGVKLIWLRV